MNTDKRRGPARQGRDMVKDKILQTVPGASTVLCSEVLEPLPDTQRQPVLTIPEGCSQTSTA